MAPGDDARAATGADLAPPSFCPECGQPLSLVPARAATEGAGGLPWRALFLVALGLYLLAVFGLDAWHASWTIRSAGVCPDEERGNGCVALPRDLALAIASGRVTTGDTFAARVAEIQFGRDVRFGAVGLTGLVVGLGALLLRGRAARPRSLGRRLGLAAEGLLALFYAEIALICVANLIADRSAGVALSWDHLADVVDRALSTFFALLGG